MAGASSVDENELDKVDIIQACHFENKEHQMARPIKTNGSIEVVRPELSTTSVKLIDGVDWLKIPLWNAQLGAKPGDTLELRGAGILRYSFNSQAVSPVQFSRKLQRACSPISPHKKGMASNTPAKPRSGLSLYANLLDPSGKSPAPGTISRAPVVFKQPGSDESQQEDASSQKQQISAGSHQFAPM